MLELNLKLSAPLSLKLKAKFNYYGIILFQEPEKKPTATISGFVLVIALVDDIVIIIRIQTEIKLSTASFAELRREQVRGQLLNVEVDLRYMGDLQPSLLWFSLLPSTCARFTWG